MKNILIDEKLHQKLRILAAAKGITIQELTHKMLLKEVNYVKEN